jgi:hypothetical protein
MGKLRDLIFIDFPPPPLRVADGGAEGGKTDPDHRGPARNRVKTLTMSDGQCPESIRTNVNTYDGVLRNNLTGVL